MSLCCLEFQNEITNIQIFISIYAEYIFLDADETLA